ncbi:transcriptional regulator [Xenorhabdus mauleonii]|uniref:Helix-turn-helix n=2 Tax=Xenorhabdus mauleonii TaxID=351675 RepID=A0A1I3WMN7_9GAMM|nr:transcriptional regulator [Xenorhabdus mauleonii]SFK08745.1 Helix-turn-helix [Xenorhabdus mauleonii]
MSKLSLQEMLQKLVESGYTQAQLSELTGVSQSSLSRILTGVSIDPRMSTASAISNLYVTHITNFKA